MCVYTNDGRLVGGIVPQLQMMNPMIAERIA